jgi:CheY-like chemotaxis protein
MKQHDGYVTGAQTPAIWAGPRAAQHRGTISESGVCTVAVIGFNKVERRVLRRTISASRDRLPSFRPFDKSLGGWPDIVIVDADLPSAMQAWNRFRRANSHRACFAPIFVSNHPQLLPPDPYVLERPIRAEKLFELLEKAVAEVHGFRPVVVSGVIHTDGAVARAAPGPANALVVDSCFPVRIQLRKALGSFAARVDFAETGMRALELIEQRPYSVVFLDVGLPDEDAYEICGLIKRNPLQQGVVAVMLTKSSSAADQVMGMLAGFDNCLVKPIKPDVLAELAAELLRPSMVI